MVGARGETNYVTTWPIRVACWLSKSTCTRPRTRAPTRTHARSHTEIYNIYCFSTVTTVTRTRLNVTIYVHCLSCLDIFPYSLCKELYLSLALPSNKLCYIILQRTCKSPCRGGCYSGEAFCHIVEVPF